MKQYVIAINGQKAVNAGYAFAGNHCFRPLYDANRYIGQLEVVLDSDESYNGIPVKWVDVTVLHREDLPQLLALLSSSGFKDCPCIIQEEDLEGCIAHDTDLCCMRI